MKKKSNKWVIEKWNRSGRKNKKGRHVKDREKKYKYIYIKYTEETSSACQGAVLGMARDKARKSAGAMAIKISLTDTMPRNMDFVLQKTEASKGGTMLKFQFKKTKLALAWRMKLMDTRPKTDISVKTLLRQYKKNSGSEKKEWRGGNTWESYFERKILKLCEWQEVADKVPGVI